MTNASRPPTTARRPDILVKPSELRRSLTLGHAVLYGLGITVGAGIYVLTGAAAERAGMQAPAAFVIAAIVMGLTGASFAEFGGRFPVAAGEAAYVQAGLRRRWLATLVGLLVVVTGIVSGAAISVGAAGYIGVFVPAPPVVLIPVVVVAMGLVAGWGIRESVTIAGIMTLVEIGGLLFIIGAGLLSEPDVIRRAPEMVPTFGETANLGGIISASLLAVFAFIGFESLANVAEEVEAPQRTLPLAIFLILAITTVLYVLVVWVSVVTVGPQELAQTNAPMAVVFEKLTGLSPLYMSAIAVVATINGVIVQIILASRVLYGMSRQGSLPAVLGQVNSRTATPLVATALTVGAMLLLATTLPLGQLADLSARVILIVFAFTNLALAVLKHTEAVPPAGLFLVPVWVPWAGFVSCLLFLLADIG